MKRFTIILAALLATVGTQAQTFTEWQDPNVNAINRQPMHSTYKVFENVADAEGAYCDQQSAYRLSLNGTWRFNWVENADQRPTDFFAPRSTTRAGTIWRFPQCGSSTAMATLST